MIYKFEFDAKVLQIILAGLDKLPGEVSRPLYNVIVQQAQQQEVDEAGRKEEEELSKKEPANAPEEENKA